MRRKYTLIIEQITNNKIKYFKILNTLNYENKNKRFHACDKVTIIPTL